MTFQVMCTRGCGCPITVTDDMLTLATKAGKPLNVAHEVCPGEDGVLHTYRVQIIVTRLNDDPDTDGEDHFLVTNGASVQAATFADAYIPLGTKLGDQWAKVGELRYIAEQDLVDSQDSEGVPTSNDA